MILERFKIAKILILLGFFFSLSTYLQGDNFKIGRFIAIKDNFMSKYLQVDFSKCVRAEFANDLGNRLFF